MPKLLSKEEVFDISAKMTEEYGLAPPRIATNHYTGSFDSGITCEIGRHVRRQVLDWFPWWRKDYFVKIKDFYAGNFEELLVQLQSELARFDGRAKVAEAFRSKYAMQEADEALNEVLRETPTN